MRKGLQTTHEDLLWVAHVRGDTQGRQAANHDEERQTFMGFSNERQAQVINVAHAAYRQHQQEHPTCWQIPERLVHLWLMTYALAYFAGYQDQLAHSRQRIGTREKMGAMKLVTNQRLISTNLLSLILSHGGHMQPSEGIQVHGRPIDACWIQLHEVKGTLPSHEEAKRLIDTYALDRKKRFQHMIEPHYEHFMYCSDEKSILYVQDTCNGWDAFMVLIDPKIPIGEH